MKNVLIYSTGKVIFIALFVYTFGEFHVGLLKMDAFDQALTEGRVIDVDVKPPMVPVILTMIMGIILGFWSWKKSRNSPVRLQLEEYEENDEREVVITSKATKSAYTSIGYTAFIAIAIMTIASYSWLQTFPALPIYLMGAIVIIATVIYAAVWCIEYQK
ncbi:hypothetical protein ACFOZY_00620 [Chungangia koreensis]|uniref:Uncharacterized protein n=1 Tax=Chungangia koreensis TaxID=752657 RepID=A0ABV8X0S4_9LACT